MARHVRISTSSPPRHSGRAFDKEGKLTLRREDAKVMEYEVGHDDGTGDDHGAHVAGTIGPAGGNGLGVVGVNWAVSIVPAKFLPAVRENAEQVSPRG